VGKTATLNRLLHDRFSEARSKTVGVDIHAWPCPLPEESADDPLRVHVWDFGGQEIYHTTHQFFLTHRSLYLLVLDATKDEAANRLDYWLRHIHNFGGDSPVLLVVNKSDQGHLSLDERTLHATWPTLRPPILHISCKTGDGLPELHQAVAATLATLPHINDRIPQSWFAVKQKLAADNRDYRPWENFLELCEAEGITHEAAQQTLARFLHDLGAALHFPDRHRLAGTHVLNPEWVTGGIYTILNAPALQERGELQSADLGGILDPRRYPSYKWAFLLDLMTEFELAVSQEDGQRWLIPGLLPKTRPDFSWSADATIALEYRYATLPASILNRLMVRLHRHTWRAENGPAVRWRNGMVLSRDGCRALVVAEPAAHRITIALDGPFPHRRQLLSIIRAQLHEIHASFRRMEPQEWVPIPGHPGAAILYRALLNLEARGSVTHYDPTHDVEINVRALLDGIEAPEERDLRELLRQGFDHLKHRIDESGRWVQSTILARLDADQMELVALLQDAADQHQLDRLEAEELIRLTQQALVTLHRLRRGQPDADQWETVLTLLQRDAGWEQKVKLTLPLIPGLLSVESEAKVDVLGALRAAWQRLVARLAVGD
jgi:internalin A